MQYHLLVLLFWGQNPALPCSSGPGQCAQCALCFVPEERVSRFPQHKRCPMLSPQSRPTGGIEAQRRGDTRSCLSAGKSWSTETQYTLHWSESTTQENNSRSNSSNSNNSCSNISNNSNDGDDHSGCIATQHRMQIDGKLCLKRTEQFTIPLQSESDSSLCLDLQAYLLEVNRVRISPATTL